ncbi:hypothetical protein K469DRAFT_204909 [Zopfia rhizophila CBS 207.26]|uniref:Uncharacterized protein n=1 Tax=Zopfia rhizophila CBS 207.26 TaxID=1314779 RepID=A0A6A6DZF6_9PEZI|nr:hypothetical protein K469DRAFT_204909 [Zopfia rhizophila CBS 207.26]
MEGGIPWDYIDYYGLTFDHLVPANDPNPEVLAISIIEVDNDGGAFANEVLFVSNRSDRIHREESTCSAKMLSD